MLADLLSPLGGRGNANCLPIPAYLFLLQDRLSPADAEVLPSSTVRIVDLGTSLCPGFGCPC